MVGTKLREKSTGDAYTVVGEFCSGWTLAPEAFGQVIHVMPDQLRADFDVRNVIEPTSSDDLTGWRRLSATFGRAVQLQRVRVPDAPSPEAVFAGAPQVGPDVRAEAAMIAADPDEFARFQIGDLDVRPEVAALLDYLSARDERAAEQHARQQARRDREDGF